VADLTALVAEGLSKRYPTSRELAVDDVSFSVIRGSVFAILGPNGAGKSTLLRILSTLLEPTSGSFRAAGHGDRDARSIRASIGLVTSDERSFFWRLTGRENLHFFAALWGLRRREADRRIADLSQSLGLEAVLDQRVDRCSAGMKHRLGLARALLHDPPVLLLDEPTRSLDPMVAVGVRTLLRRLVDNEGKTLVLVTHDVAEAATLADRAAIMYRGRLREIDDPERLPELFRPRADEDDDAAWARVVDPLEPPAPPTTAREMSPAAGPRLHLAGILGAFLRRDAQIHLSYRLAMALQVVGVALSAATFFFVGRLVGDGGPHLEPYGGAYFPFVIVGLAFFSFQSVALSRLSATIRDGQLSGTLEAMLSTATPLPVLLGGSTLWPFLQSAFRAALFLALGVLGFGLSLRGVSVATALTVVALLVAATLGLGLVSAAFVVVFKRGDPVQLAIASLTTLLSGVYFPVSLLPSTLRAAADLLPLTFALEGLRKTLLDGAVLADLGGEVLALGVFTVILVPVGLATFSRAVRHAKRAGTLGQY